MFFQWRKGQFGSVNDSKWLTTTENVELCPKETPLLFLFFFLFFGYYKFVYIFKKKKKSKPYALRPFGLLDFIFWAFIVWKYFGFVYLGLVSSPITSKNLDHLFDLWIHPWWKINLRVSSGGKWEEPVFWLCLFG